MGRTIIWIIFLHASFCMAQTDDQEAEASETIADRIEKLSVDKNLINASVEYIDSLIKKARLDQDAIYTFVRTINRNIDELDPNEGNIKFIKDVREITRRLLKSSYTDKLFQNGNLSNQIKTRIPLLIEDSLKVVESPTEYRKSDFLDELDIFAYKYLNSKRFSLGIGLSQSYIPKIKYNGQTKIDLSPFASSISGGSNSILFNNEFSNESYSSLLLNLKIPYASAEALFPKYKNSHATGTEVQYRNIDETTEVLYQSEIISELTIEYDVGLKFSADEIISAVFKRESSSQIAYGFGFGATGFQIENTVTTDIRFRLDPSQSFNQLPNGEKIQFEDARSYSAHYLLLYYNFEISDEFSVGLNLRSYKSSSSSEVDIDGEVFSMTAVWYPTFDFLQ